LAARIRGAYARLGLDEAGVRSFCDEFVCEDPQVHREELSPAEVAILGRGAELATVAPAAYAAWLLGYYLALRAGEIAACRWTWFERRADGVLECVVRDRPEENFSPKGYSGWIPVAENVWSLLQAIRSDDVYVVPGGSHTARYNAVGRVLAGVMRSWGWTKLHCSHELRAYRGQKWRDAYGAEVARDWLRHASLEVQRHYTVGHNTRHAPLDT
jgi:integrase